MKMGNSNKTDHKGKEKKSDQLNITKSDTSKTIISTVKSQTTRSSTNKWLASALHRNLIQVRKD